MLNASMMRFSNMKNVANIRKATDLAWCVLKNVSAMMLGAPSVLQLEENRKAIEIAEKNAEMIGSFKRSN